MISESLKMHEDETLPEFLQRLSLQNAKNIGEVQGFAKFNFMRSDSFSREAGFLFSLCAADMVHFTTLIAETINLTLAIKNAIDLSLELAAQTLNYGSQRLVLLAITTRDGFLNHLALPSCQGMIASLEECIESLESGQLETSQIKNSIDIIKAFTLAMEKALKADADFEANSHAFGGM